MASALGLDTSEFDNSSIKPSNVNVEPVSFDIVNCCAESSFTVPVGVAVAVNPFPTVYFMPFIINIGVFDTELALYSTVI